MKKTFFIIIALVSICIGGYAQFAILPPLEKNKINLFPLDNIRITNPEIKSLQDKDMEYLLALDVDKLLAWFRREAGLTPKNTPYPSWESEGDAPLSGHILGFYLSSMSMMYQTTKNPMILNRLKYVVQEMKLCQDAQGDGYLSAQAGAKQALLDVANGKGSVNGWQIGGTFEPTYVMNKLMLGLYGVYNACGIADAKDVLIKLADWIGYNLLDRLNHDGIQNLLVCEHGSLNESFVDVYSLTGNCKYLEWAKMLNHEEMLTPFSHGKDILDGWHANCQIPKFTGFLRIYRYDRIDSLLNAANFFWNTVVDNRTWVNGGNTTSEHFFNVNDFGKKVSHRGGPESCNSVNMMRLTEALYEEKAQMKQVDYYERVLFNHILANYKQDDAQCVYYTSMRPGHYKIHAMPFKSFYCCAGTGLEAPAKFGKMIYAYDADTLFVNMFVASSVKWEEKGVTVIQQTTFPDSARSFFMVQTSQNVPLCLKIRVPYWTVLSEFKVMVNGEVVSGVINNGYIDINRIWKNNDEIEVSYPPKLMVESLKNSDDYVSVQYGPFVLGTEVDNHGLPTSAFQDMYKTVGDVVIPEFEVSPMIGTTNNIADNIKRKKSSKLLFTYNSPTGQQVELKPYYRIHLSRYALYFMHFNTVSEYENQKSEYNYEKEQKLQKLHALTVDSILIANNFSETLHSMQTSNSDVGQTFGLWWRHAWNGGFFQYNMKVNPFGAQSVYLVFCASDSGNRIFDVLIDGKLLQTINHNNPVGGVTPLYPYLISIPESYISGKSNVVIRIQGKAGNMAGGVFDLRILSTGNMQDVPNLYEYLNEN